MAMAITLGDRMNANWRLIWLMPAFCGCLLHADDLAPATLAKILKLVVADAKEPAIACNDPLVRFELEKLGVTFDPDSRIVWVKTPQEKTRYRGTNRVTISGQVSDLSGGVIVALVGEGGRCVFYVSKANVDNNKVVLPAAIIKLGKVL
jgi:hypothetical protein